MLRMIAHLHRAPRRLALSCALAALALPACTVKEVRVGLHDKNPPSITIMLVAGEDRVELVGGRDEPTTLKIPAWEEAYLVAYGGDSLGVKEVSITSMSGGNLLNYADGSLSAEVRSTRDTTAEGIGLSRLDVVCRPAFTSGEVTIRAKATDWAGNVLYSPAVRVEKVLPPTAKFSTTKNWALQGGSVSLKYETTNADTVIIGIGGMNTRSGVISVPALSPANEVRMMAIGPFDTAIAKQWVYLVPNSGQPVIGGLKTDPVITTYAQDYDLIYDVSDNVRTVQIARIDYSSAKSRDTIRTGEDNSDHVPIKIVATGASGTAELEFTPRFMWSQQCQTEWLPLGDFRAIAHTAQGQVMVANNAAKKSRKDPLMQNPIIEVRNGSAQSLVLEMGGKWLRLGPGEVTSAFAGMHTYLDKLVISPTTMDASALSALQYSVQNRWCNP